MMCDTCGHRKFSRVTIVFSILLEVVEFPVFFLHIRQEGFRVEASSRHALGEVIRREHSAPAMNFLPEPTLQHHQLSCRDFILQMRDLQFGLLIELNGIEISERVRRELAKGAERPMYALNSAFRIVRG